MTTQNSNFEFVQWICLFVLLFTLIVGVPVYTFGHSLAHCRAEKSAPDMPTCVLSGIVSTILYPFYWSYFWQKEEAK